MGRKSEAAVERQRQYQRDFQHPSAPRACPRYRRWSLVEVQLKGEQELEHESSSPSTLSLQIVYDPAAS